MIPWPSGLVASPALAAEIQHAIEHEEAELRRKYVESIGGVMLNGAAYDGPRRYSEDDDLELWMRGREPTKNIGELIAALSAATKAPAT